MPTEKQLKSASTVKSQIKKLRLFMVIISNFITPHVIINELNGIANPPRMSISEISENKDFSLRESQNGIFFYTLSEAM